MSRIGSFPHVFLTYNDYYQRFRNVYTDSSLGNYETFPYIYWKIQYLGDLGNLLFFPWYLRFLADSLRVLRY